MKLYRPVNQYELQKIKDLDWKAFPPRLKEQPIFYVVLSKGYAERINEWNKLGYGEGYVLEFEINYGYICKYKVHNVGGKDDNEYWIPGKDIDEFNKNIIGKIILTE